MKIKEKPIKKTMSHAVMPMLAYVLIEVLMMVVYVFLVSFPKLEELISRSNGITMEEAVLLYENILSGDSVLIMLLMNVGVLAYALNSFVRSESFSYDRRYENKITIRDVLMLSITAVGLYFAVNIVITVLVQMFSGLGSSMNELNTTVGGLIETDLTMSIVVVGLLAPAVEELLVRGLIFNRFRKIGSVSFAMLSSAMIFSGMHMPMIIQCIYTFGLGVIFAWAYYKYENILAPIILHMVYNMCSFMFLIEPVGAFFSTLGGLLVFYALGVGLTWIGCKYIKRKVRPRMKDRYAELLPARESAEEAADMDDFE